MSDDLLNFHEQLYVGTKNLALLDVNDPPLGFATPYGTDKAAEKRKETVDNWCGKPVSQVRRQNPDGSYALDAQGYGIWDEVQLPHSGPHIIDNVLLEGFSVDKSVERYSTSNKLFRINDPRGFQLEISTENLCDILLRGAVINGVFQGKYVWGRKGGTNYLTREDHSSYQHYLAPAIDRDMQVGDRVHLGQNPLIYQYLGKFYKYELDCIYTHQDPPQHMRPRNYYGGSGKYAVETPVTRFKRFVEKKDAKAIHVFKIIFIDNDAREEFHFLKSNPKAVRILSENHATPTGFELGKFQRESYGDPKVFFETKAEIDAFSPTFEEKLAQFADENNVTHKTDWLNQIFTDVILDQPGPVPGEQDYRYYG